MASAAPLLCAGITVYSPMIRHKMNEPGKSLGVIGLGGLGHMAVKFGKAFGLNVTVLSTSIFKKEEALTLLGADKFVVSSDQEQMKVDLHKISNKDFFKFYEQAEFIEKNTQQVLEAAWRFSTSVDPNSISISESVATI